MMSVLIKGIDMPRNCEECEKMGLIDVVPICFENMNNHCPLVDVQTPHGRLIDSSMLLITIHDNSYLIRHGYNEVEYGMSCPGIIQAVSEQPTVIEAEVEE